MNYFEFFDLPVAYEVDQALLKRLYYQRSRALHPDFHSLADEETKEEMLRMSSFNNQAYKTLSDGALRLRHLLEIHGKLDEQSQHELPQDFLMQMMDINESMVELSIEPDAGAINQLVKQIEEVHHMAQREVATLLSKSAVTYSEHEWGLLLEYYHKGKYLTRLKQQMAEI